MGVFQSILSLSANGLVDYIGPDFASSLFNEKVKKLFILHPDKQTKICGYIKNYLTKKVTTSFYSAWKNIEPYIKWENYDIVHVEASRYQFLVDKVHDNSRKVIIRVHNIEADYGFNIFKHRRRIGDYLRYYSFKTNEKQVMKKADGLIFLSQVDITRAKEIYGIDKPEIYLNPVCVEEREINSQNSGSVINILMTGTLSYGANSDGVIWFLKQVWSEISCNKKDNKFSLTIAGSNPPQSIADLIHTFPDVKLVDTPDNMRIYFESADVYVASIFYGAGMKVKVAEALSYGIPVIATDCALVGYENISEGIVQANSVVQFIDNIRKTKKLSGEQRRIIRDCFKETLSLESSSTRYREILNHYVE